MTPSHSFELDSDELDLRGSGRKLDIAYFTEPGRCSLMVQRRARAGFEVFLYLAHRYLQADGRPVVATHEELCAACGLDPKSAHSSSTMSRLLRSLRETYRVIDFSPIQRRRPEISLAPPRPGADLLNPGHYVYFEGWNVTQRELFHSLGSRTFAAEYLYWIALYESALARVKHQRPYWFFPLDRISTTYHISQRFASVGLRALVDLGIMRVVPGQRGRIASQNEFGAANRYYFEGLGEVVRRDLRLQDLQSQHPAEFDLARVWTQSLINGTTVKNVAGLCELAATYGAERVDAAIQQLSGMSPRNLKRRLAYVRWLVAGSQDGGQ